jgi:hypothetical protein
MARVSDCMDRWDIFHIYLVTKQIDRYVDPVSKELSTLFKKIFQCHPVSTAWKQLSEPGFYLISKIHSDFI